MEVYMKKTKKTKNQKNKKSKNQKNKKSKKQKIKKTKKKQKIKKKKTKKQKNKKTKNQKNKKTKVLFFSPQIKWSVCHVPLGAPYASDHAQQVARFAVIIILYWKSNKIV